MFNRLKQIDASATSRISNNNSLVGERYHLFKINDMPSQNFEKTHETTMNPVNKLAINRAQSLHVLLVTETWLPDINGVAMSLHQIMSQFVTLGHKVSLLRPKPQAKKNNPESKRANSILTSDIQVMGFAIPRYPDLQFGMPAYNRIGREIRQLNPDIVHIATEGPLGLAALMAAKQQKIPATTGYHTQFHDFSRHFGFGVLARPLIAYFKWFHNASKATCVPSPKTQNDLDKLGFQRLIQVGRGVDLETFNPEHRSLELRDSWGACKRHTVLIMVSRLSPEKGVDLVIEAFKALQSTQLNRALKLVVVGGGPDRKRLESLAASSEDDIIFAGTKMGLELARHYASADAFVFASQVETFGNVVTEAMASGLPIYAFDDAAAGMLVATESKAASTLSSGNLVPLGATNAFIEMVKCLPKMNVLKSQGKRAVEQVAGFSWQRPARQIQVMFTDVLHQHYHD